MAAVLPASALVGLCQSPNPLHWALSLSTVGVFRLGDSVLWGLSCVLVALWQYLWSLKSFLLGSDNKKSPGMALW